MIKAPLITETPLINIGVATIVIREDNTKVNTVLLGRRLKEWGTGLLQCPGGHPDPNESFEMTAWRETFEETNLVLNIDTMKFLNYQDDYFSNIDRWYRTFFYAARPLNSNQLVINKEPTKCGGWNWYRLETLLPEELHAINAKTLMTIFQFLNGNQQ